MILTEEMFADAREEWHRMTQYLSEDAKWDALAGLVERLELGEVQLKEAWKEELLVEVGGAELCSRLGQWEAVRRHKWWKAFRRAGKPIASRLHILRLNLVSK